VEGRGKARRNLLLWKGKEQMWDTVRAVEPKTHVAKSRGTYKAERGDKYINKEEDKGKG
jgi:hypothetical protein